VTTSPGRGHVAFADWTELERRVTIRGVFIPRRLDKYLRESTSLSVVEIRRAWAEGRVRVRTENALCFTTSGSVGVSDTGLGDGIPPIDTLIFEDDEVTLDGTIVTPRENHHYLIFNKPRYVTTTAHDPDGDLDLRPWLAQMPEGVFPVGRLDRETTGLLIFTNDGSFANAILQPGHHTQKTYWLWLDEHLTDDDKRLAAFVEGVPRPFEGDALKATSVEIWNRTLDYTELHVTLEEGKNRQLRKMCNLLRLRLLELHRKKIGSLELGSLGLGQWRSLASKEVAQLWSDNGGIAKVDAAKIAALSQFADVARRRENPLLRLESWLTALKSN
jgi:23S rRNA pseudouridine2605 synthase